MFLTIANQIAYRLPRQSIRNALGQGGLSPHELFLRDGYTELLYRDHDLTSEDSVLILGGFLGDSATKWRSLFGVFVDVVEPVPDFANVLRDRFSADSRVRVHEVALSDRDGLMILSVACDSTGRYAQGCRDVPVTSRRAAVFIKHLPRMPRLMEINIEGGEYSVLTDLLDADLIPDLLIIQFHNNHEYSELLRAQIRDRLRATHVCVMNYEWVWEKWERQERHLLG